MVEWYYLGNKSILSSNVIRHAAVRQLRRFERRLGGAAVYTKTLLLLLLCVSRRPSPGHRRDVVLKLTVIVTKTLTQKCYLSHTHLSQLACLQQGKKKRLDDTGLSLCVLLVFFDYRRLLKNILSKHRFGWYRQFTRSRMQRRMKKKMNRK